MPSETDLLHAFIQHVPYALPHVGIWRRNIINTTSVHGFHARNGIAGQSDAYAICDGGRHIEIETKAARGAMREAQIAWRKRCLDRGIPHLVLRAGKDELFAAIIARWTEELRAVCQ